MKKIRQIKWFICSSSIFYSMYSTTCLERPSHWQYIYVVSQERWSLLTGSITLPGMWSFETGDLSWRWSLTTGFTVVRCKDSSSDWICWHPRAFSSKEKVFLFKWNQYHEYDLLVNVLTWLTRLRSIYIHDIHYTCYISCIPSLAFLKILKCLKNASSITSNFSRCLLSSCSSALFIIYLFY